MRDQQLHYRSYLLRCWRNNLQGPWRVSLESTATGEKQSFATLSALVVFLVAHLAETEREQTLAQLIAQLQTQKDRQE
jgi:hypothetical protein